MISVMLVAAAAAAPADPASAWTHFTDHYDVNTGLLREDAPAAPACLTGVMKDLRENLDALSAEQREAALLALEPWRAARQGAPPPAPCIGHYGENYVVGEHFSVEWDGSTVSEATAQAFLEALEFSWGVEVDELGWAEPAGATDTQILAYIASGNQAGAYTTVTSCSSGPASAMPYIVAYAGSFNGNTGWYKTMAAHEFQHATQFYYGYGHEFYYWEATASWLEEYVYPNQNDWASSIAYGYSQQPHISMNASDQNDNDIFWHMYAMAVWNFYLDEHVGGHDLIQEIWENAPRNGQYDYWMPDAIEDTGLDFAEVYTGFLATAAVMDFSEERYFILPDTTDVVDSLPASGAGDRDLPQSLGQNFILIEDGAAGDGETVSVSFDGEDGVEWFAVLARGTENNLDTYTTIELDEDGVGTGTIEAEDGQDLYLIVSPMDDAAVGSSYRWSSATGFDYEWSAEIFEGGEGGGNGNGNNGNGNGNGNGDGKSGLCATSASAAGLGWLLALSLVGWRRQR